MMPLEPGDIITMPVGATNENMDEYTVTATPGSGWFAIIGGDASDRGEALITSMTPVIDSQDGGDPYKMLKFKVIAADEADEDAANSCSLRVQITGPSGEK